MSYSIKTKLKAISLRKQGFSVKEIARLLDIAVGTSSRWVGSVKLNQRALNKIESKKVAAQFKANETRRIKTQLLKQSTEKVSKEIVSRISFNSDLFKLICSLFFWTEGGKSSDSYVFFTNSDPDMIIAFLTSLRSSYQLDEKKFRAMVHLHNYHDKNRILQFWSDLTQIPLSQFSKCYIKPSTHIRIRPNYMGCIRIRYYDYKIALELRSIYNIWVKNIRAWRNW